MNKTLVLFPIRIDDAVMATDAAWTASIRRTRYIGGFTRWKEHDAYQTAFERLLRDLKDESTVGAGTALALIVVTGTLIKSPRAQADDRDAAALFNAAGPTAWSM